MWTTVATHEKFEIKVDPEAKHMFAKVKGYFYPEDAGASLQAYRDALGRIDPKESTLSIDCTELDTSAPEMVDVLVSCFDLYHSDGFQHIRVLRPSSASALFQLKRAISSSSAKNVEIATAL